MRHLCFVPHARHGLILFSLMLAGCDRNSNKNPSPPIPQPALQKPSTPAAKPGDDAFLVGTEAGAKATLKIERPPQFSGGGSTIDVYVNEKKLGTVAGASSSSNTPARQEFIFDTLANGKNRLKLLIPATLQSEPLGTFESEFVALPGSVIRVVAPLEKLSNFPPKYDIKATISLEKQGIEPAQILSVNLDKQMKTIVIKESSPIVLARGTEKTVEDTVKIRHSVAIAERWKVETEVKAAVNSVWASASLRIKGEIERSTNATYAVETERKRSVTIKGDGAGKVVVTWVEYYRTGTAKMAIDGRTIDVPFEFREDFDLLTRNAD